MVNEYELSLLLSRVNVEDVARVSGLSTKTIYRLRHQQNSPTLATVRRILDALRELEKQAA
jgi:predicted transcriptional regulator